MCIVACASASERMRKREKPRRISETIIICNGMLTIHLCMVLPKLQLLFGHGYHQSCRKMKLKQMKNRSTMPPQLRVIFSLLIDFHQFVIRHSGNEREKNQKKHPPNVLNVAYLCVFGG